MTLEGSTPKDPPPTDRPAANSEAIPASSAEGTQSATPATEPTPSAGVAPPSHAAWAAEPPPLPAPRAPPPQWVAPASPPGPGQFAYAAPPGMMAVPQRRSRRRGCLIALLVVAIVILVPIGLFLRIPQQFGLFRAHPEAIFSQTP